jgi:hypothetical protein
VHPDATTGISSTALIRYLQFAAHPESSSVDGVRYCLKALLRLSSSLEASAVLYSLLWSAASLGCVTEALELLSKLPQPKFHLLKLCHQLEANISTSTGMLMFLRAISHSILLLGAEIDAYWDEQFNSQLSSTAGTKAVEEDYMTTARTREEVLKLAAQEKSDLVSAADSYFSRFTTFLVAVLLDQGQQCEFYNLFFLTVLCQDGVTRNVRVAAAEALSSVMKLSPELAGKRDVHSPNYFADLVPQKHTYLPFFSALATAKLIMRCTGVC